MKRKLAANTIAQIAGRAISALATLGITIIIARRLGAGGYGDFVKITTFIAFFYLLADFGFNAIYLQSKDSHWGDLLILRMLVSSFLVLVVLAVVALLPRGSAQGYTGLVRFGIIIFAPSIIFQALITCANALFQKHLRYAASTIAIAAGSLVSLALVFFVASQSASSGVLWAVVSLLVGSAATAVVAMWLAKSLEQHIALSFDGARMRSLFMASLPLGVTLLFNLVYFRVDSIILTLTRATADVGIYGLAYKVFEFPLVLPTFFMNALYPVLLQATPLRPAERDFAGQASDTFKNLVVRSAKLLLLVSCLMSLALWFGAPMIAYIKNDFAPGIWALRVLSLGLPFFFLSSLTMWTLIAKRKQKTLVAIYGISMMVNVSLNALFIPSYGYMAAAWITVASEALVLFLSILAVLKILNPLRGSGRVKS